MASETDQTAEMLSLMMGILTDSRGGEGCEIRAWLTTRYLWIRLRWPKETGKRRTEITQQVKARFVRGKLAEEGAHEAARYFTRYLSKPGLSEVR
jgi:hypothetical protein